ncbi:sphingolipid homeostasis protein orm1 [Balamuthia mandrillaris]
MQTGGISLENRNVTWLGRKGAWVVYILAVVSGRLLLSFFPWISSETAWTLTYQIHAVVTYYAFHWDKGVPFTFSDQGKYDALTVWEQLDQGVQFTPTRKVLTVIPIILFMITSHYTHYHPPTLVLNLIALAVLIVAKIPQMHKVRIFGVNAGPSMS